MVIRNTQLRVTEDTLLLAAQAIFVARIPFDASRVLISTLAPQQVPLFQADQFLSLRLGSSLPIQIVVDGGGRVDSVERVQLEVALFTRCSLDDAPQDAQRLTNADLGHYVYRSKVVDALQIDLMEDEHFNMPVIEPVRVLSRSLPQRHPVEPDWALSVVVFDLPYEALLDQSRQG